MTNTFRPCLCSSPCRRSPCTALRPAFPGVAAVSTQGENGRLKGSTRTLFVDETVYVSSKHADSLGKTHKMVDYVSAMPTGTPATCSETRNGHIRSPTTRVLGG